MEGRNCRYSIGFDKEVLSVDGDVMNYELDGETLCLLCYVNKEEMEICFPNSGNHIREKLDIREKEIIDLNDNGERWEGFSLNELPFGFGKLYNENNALRYSGYMYKGKKVCFGEEYNEDGVTVEFKGNFYLLHYSSFFNKLC